MPPVITNKKITNKHTPDLARWNRSRRSCTMRCAELCSTRRPTLREFFAKLISLLRAVTGLGAKLITTLPTQAGWQADPE